MNIHVSKPVRFEFVVALVLAFFYLLYGPLPHRSIRGIRPDGTHYTKDFQRTYEVLPAYEWGLSPVHIYLCGGKGGGSLVKRRFVFVAVADKIWTQFER